MQIRIKPDRWDYLKPVSGMFLTVETDYLFGDQFNTAPVPGISESGFRVMMRDVAEIIGDVRPGRMRCNWCGKHSVRDEVCHYCGKSEYLEKFGGRYFPDPLKNKVEPPEDNRKVPNSKSPHGRGAIYVRNRGAGCAGDDWDNPTHRFSILYGPKKSNGEFSDYVSLTYFYKDSQVSVVTKAEVRRMIETWSKEMGY